MKKRREEVKLNKVLSNLFWKLESLWAEDTLNTLLSIYEKNRVL